MKTGYQPAVLVLEDGTVFRGRAVGAPGETFGELVFNTGMTGYQEVLTDPSYRGQIVVMTYPEVGIYGVNPEDVESSRVQVAGYVVHHAIRMPFNQRATLAFTDYLVDAGVVAIEGVDTRAVTRHLRMHGAMRGTIATRDLDPASALEGVRQSRSMKGCNLAAEAACDEMTVLGNRDGARSHVVVIDAGYKGGIVRDLLALGAAVTVMPYDASIDGVLAQRPDGVLVSNGPGDPEPLVPTITLMQALLSRGVPLGGICLGHQLLGLAAGGKTYKMRFGHRGANHPVKDTAGGRILITTQNHGFAVDPTSLGIPWAPIDAAFSPANPGLCRVPNPHAAMTMAEMLPPEPLTGTSPAGFGPVEVTHLSLNDGTVEGLRLQDYPALSVQYHPEASPGPHDARDFFDRFLDMVERAHA